MKKCLGETPKDLLRTLNTTSKEVPEGLCKRLKRPTKKAKRQLVKLLRYEKGTKKLANRFPKEGLPDKILGMLDRDRSPAWV